MAERDIAGIVAQADLPAIVSAYTEIKKRGKEYVLLCPFHADNDPSMGLFHKGGKWQFYCHPCGKGGDALDWVMEIEHLDTKAALDRLTGGTYENAPKRPVRDVAPQPERVTSKPPADAGEPNMHIRDLGDPVKAWAYRDEDGALLGYAARYDTADGKKEFRCWTWGARGDQAPGWGCGHWSKPRPLYGLDRLHRLSGAPVLVVEGEKAADAAQALLGQYVVVTWPGGAKAWKHADWNSLRGRRVDLWPDNDPPGVEAMDSLRAILSDKRGLACWGKSIDPAGMSEGFDAADWPGTADDLIAWLRKRATEYPNTEPQAEGGAVPPLSAAPSPAAPVPPEDSPEPPPAEFPPEATVAAKPPKKTRQRPRLAAVDGNNALAPDAEPAPAPVPLSEDAFATYFAEQHGENWRCVRAWGKWFNWDGEAWAEDRTDCRVEPMREIFQSAQYWPEASELNPSQRRGIFGRKVPMYSALILAGTDKRIRAEPEIWDADPWAMGVPGGVIDLKTGKLMASAREQHLTMRCSVAPAAGKPALWLRMLDQWMGSDPDVIGFLRRYLGYALTGDSREQCMMFFYGKAQAGKGTIMRAISGIMGSGQDGGKFRSYHYEAPISTFMESRSDRHTTELAAFYKKRLITSEEPAAGAKWDEGKLKWITGGSQITARFIAQDNFSFTMSGKIIVAANHRPRLATTDKAIRRRMLVVPFEHPVADEDRDNLLDAKLREEWPQILAWLIEGCLEWQQAGLGMPERIASSTDQYLESEDTIGAWLEECTDRDRDTEGALLYKSYSAWCDRNGDNPFSRRGWANALVERGFETRKGAGGVRMIRGLSLKASESLPTSGPGWSVD
jgi:putative DNA primase/helicase